MAAGSKARVKCNNPAWFGWVLKQILQTELASAGRLSLALSNCADWCKYNCWLWFFSQAWVGKNIYDMDFLHAFVPDLQCFQMLTSGPRYFCNCIFKLVYCYKYCSITFSVKLTHSRYMWQSSLSVSWILILKFIPELKYAILILILAESTKCLEVHHFFLP